METKYIKELQKCGKMFYIAATGGGMSFIGCFLKTPGGSKCIAGGNIPYASQATDIFLGSKLEKYSDGNAARRLAVASFTECVKIVNYDNINKEVTKTNCVGIGVACSLVRENERINREHVINIAIHTFDQTFGVTVTLKNSKMTRKKEEEFVNDLIMFQLATKYCKKVAPAWKIIHQMICLENGGTIEEFNSVNTCVNGIYPYNPTSHENVNITDIEPKYGADIVIYPGSFNPLHSSHIEIYNLSKEITGLPVFYELSVVHSYKHQMDYVDLNNRVKQFQNEKYLITESPRFRDKVMLLKQRYNVNEIIIVVGADTWEHVYDDASHKNGDIKFFENNNVKFLVFGRNMEIKNKDSQLFLNHRIALEYNKSMSSTQLRKDQVSA